MPLKVPLIREAETGFVSDEVQADVNVDVSVGVGAGIINVSLPSGASMVRATVFATIVVMNQANVANKVGMELQVNGHSVFRKDSVFGFPPYDGLTSTITITQDASDYVTEGLNMVELFVTQSAASPVRYTVQYTIIITYRMNVE